MTENAPTPARSTAPVNLSNALAGLPGHLSERVVDVSREQRDADRPAEFVLYWMHSAMRAHENAALDVALELARAAELPLLVYQALSERHPYANDRHYVFALQGAADVAAECAELGLRYVCHLERPGQRGPVLRQLAERATCVVTEAVPVQPLRRWTERLGTGATPVCTVDAACVVPLPLVDAAPDRAFAFRRATAKVRKQRLTRAWPASDALAQVAAFHGALPFDPLDLATLDPFAAVADCAIDHSVAPVPGERGGTRAGYARWEAFKARRLACYAHHRNDPARDGTSRLSAYFHYGMIAPQRIAREAAEIGSSGAVKFLDELLVWREVAWAFCHHTPDVDALCALPDWARASLAEHADDPRSALSSETLARGSTGDRLWDAAQRSLLVRGELHNNVRMTWGKALLGWTRSPQEALDRMIELNHRYALDGRDPASYGGLLWCLGRFDRPFPPARPVEGVLRARPTAPHAARIDLDAYAALAARPAAAAALGTRGTAAASEPSSIPDPAHAGAQPLRVAVIGAGLAGLAAARTLQDHGHHATVFEKGRGPGGRSSSRRAEPFAFDHGAQYFTARDPLFQRCLTSWREDGVVAPWQGRIVALTAADPASPPVPTSPCERFVGTPAMNALPKHLARDLTLRCGTQVAPLERAPTDTSENGARAVWQLRSDSGEALGAFDRVVIAAPPLQVQRLLPESAGLHALVERAARIEMRPCWAVLLGFDAPLEVDFDGAFCSGSSLAWIARNSSKPDRPAAEAWVLHATPEWSASRLDADRAEIAAELRAEFERALGRPLPAVLHRDAHRWGFALPATPDAGTPSGALFDAASGLAIAGDAYAGGRVEGAFLSGVAAAAHILRDHARRVDALLPAPDTAAATAAAAACPNSSAGA